MTPDFPAWTLPVIAISVLVIALVMLAFAIGAVFAMRNISERLEEQQKLLKEGQALIAMVKAEAEALVRTSRGVRKAVVRGVRRTREKLLDLEALYDVVHEEVQDTALDVASTLRSVRRGGGVLSRLRRFIVPGR